MLNAIHAGQRRGTVDHAIADQPELSFGVLYPQNDVVAVIDDYHQAELGARALLDAGIPGDEIDVVGGRYFAAVIAGAKRKRGLLGRAGACLSRLFSDDADYEQTLLDEARRDHAVVVVHAEDPALAERAGGILRACGVHDVSYYRRGSIQDLV